jgi:hypothetical protein
MATDMLLINHQRFAVLIASIYLKLATIINGFKQ